MQHMKTNEYKNTDFALKLQIFEYYIVSTVTKENKIQEIIKKIITN